MFFHKQPWKRKTFLWKNIPSTWLWKKHPKSDKILWMAKSLENLGFQEFYTFFFPMTTFF